MGEIKTITVTSKTASDYGQEFGEKFAEKFKFQIMTEKSITNLASSAEGTLPRYWYLRFPLAIPALSVVRKGSLHLFAPLAGTLNVESAILAYNSLGLEGEKEHTLDCKVFEEKESYGKIKYSETKEGKAEAPEVVSGQQSLLKNQYNEITVFEYKALLQKTVEDKGWKSGNHIVVVFKALKSSEKGTANCNFEAYNYNPGKEPFITVEYEEFVTSSSVGSII